MPPLPPGIQVGDRLRFLEGMRGLAALYVVLGHIASMVDPSFLTGHRTRVPFWMHQMLSPFQFGHLAVAAFIVISGFCLQLSLFNSGNGRIQSIRQFFRKRARRILPAYYACLAVSILVSLAVTRNLPGMPFESYVPVTTANVLAHVALVQNFSPDWMYKLNGVLWSIAIEAQLYLLFPALVKMLFRIGRAKTLIVTILASVALLSVLPEGMKLYLWYLPLFVLGMSAAHLAYRPHVVRGPSFRVGLAMAGVAMVASLALVQTGSLMPYSDAAFGTAIAAISYVGLVQPQVFGIRMLALRPLAGLGAFSYSLYLMHHPIEQVAFWLKPAFVQGDAGTLAYLFLVGLPLMTSLSWVFSLAFERPFISRARVVVNPRELVPVSLPLKVVNRNSKMPIIKMRNGQPHRKADAVARSA